MKKLRLSMVLLLFVLVTASLSITAYAASTATVTVTASEAGAVTVDRIENGKSATSPCQVVAQGQSISFSADVNSPVTIHLYPADKKDCTGDRKDSRPIPVSEGGIIVPIPSFIPQVQVFIKDAQPETFAVTYTLNGQTPPAKCQVVLPNQVGESFTYNADVNSNIVIQYFPAGSNCAGTPSGSPHTIPIRARTTIQLPLL